MSVSLPFEESERSASRARELGAFEFIPKRVDFDHLKAQLRQLPATAG
jgi:hypothetical protein